ncbi:hypothetical protein ACFOWX_01835 [Sphingorhabdus arenilitoris]|uniref:Transposase n=1 Tax=Sphingorhabdus arenilitoris TaxID=1490041 RepID=A0ABV8RCT7_9SPHN
MSKGGLSTKVNAATDALGNPVRFILIGGQRALHAIAASSAKPAVPRRTTTASWRSFDATIYKDRNLIKRVSV